LKNTPYCDTSTCRKKKKKKKNPRPPVPPCPEKGEGRKRRALLATKCCVPRPAERKEKKAIFNKKRRILHTRNPFYYVTKRKEKRITGGA